MSNSKITITTDTGDKVEAMAPVIVSASRSTDIPAFYAKWFFNRLEKGYCVWCNPFNQKPSYVAFKNCKVIVFWTKNPRPIFPYLNTLDCRGIHYYFQVTLNDYEKENFEPNVPPLAERIETFKELSRRVGKDKVIWRFDPLIVTSGIAPRELLRRIWRIGNALKGYTVSARTERGQDLDLWFRFYAAGFKGDNIEEPLYMVYEGRDAIKRRKLKYAFYATQTKIIGFRLLKFPLLKFIYAFVPLLSYFIPRKLKLARRRR